MRTNWIAPNFCEIVPPRKEGTWTQKYLKLNSTLPVHDVRRLSVPLSFFFFFSFKGKKIEKGRGETKTKKKENQRSFFSFFLVCLFGGRAEWNKKLRRWMSNEVVWARPRPATDWAYSSSFGRRISRAKKKNRKNPKQKKKEERSKA